MLQHWNVGHFCMKTRYKLKLTKLIIRAATWKHLPIPVNQILIDSLPFNERATRKHMAYFSPTWTVVPVAAIQLHCLCRSTREMATPLFTKPE